MLSNARSGAEGRGAQRASGKGGVRGAEGKGALKRGGKHIVSSYARKGCDHTIIPKRIRNRSIQLWGSDYV